MRLLSPIIRAAVSESQGKAILSIFYRGRDVLRAEEITRVRTCTWCRRAAKKRRNKKMKIKEKWKKKLKSKNEEKKGSYCCSPCGEVASRDYRLISSVRYLLYEIVKPAGSFESSLDRARACVLSDVSCLEVKREEVRTAISQPHFGLLSPTTYILPLMRAPARGPAAGPIKRALTHPSAAFEESATTPEDFIRRMIL